MTSSTPIRWPTWLVEFFVFKCYKPYSADALPTDRMVVMVGVKKLGGNLPRKCRQLKWFETWQTGKKGTIFFKRSWIIFQLLIFLGDIVRFQGVKGYVFLVCWVYMFVFFCFFCLGNVFSFKYPVLTDLLQRNCGMITVDGPQLTPPCWFFDIDVYYPYQLRSRLPSRGLTYPTLGKGKSSSKMPFLGDMLVSWKGILFGL